MNQEVKTKWLTALKSGFYKKGKNRLRRDDEFCCLGVLCDLYSKEVGVPWKENGIFLGHKAYLPPKVAEWASSSDNTLQPKAYSLIEINDETETFEEVIRVIEEKL